MSYSGDDGEKIWRSVKTYCLAVFANIAENGLFVDDLFTIIYLYII